MPKMNCKISTFALHIFTVSTLLSICSCDLETMGINTTNSSSTNTANVTTADSTKSTVDKSLSNSIANLKFIEVESKKTGNQYRVGIGFPNSYHTAKDKVYPVVYQLNAETALHTSLETSRGLALSGDLEEVIVVGIFNPSLNSDLLDLTPSKATDPSTKLAGNIKEGIPTGGSELFFQFLVDELMPIINANYRTDKMSNVLFGHSLGGLFCLSALQKDKSPFSHYLISSPAVWWNNQEILKNKLPKRNFQPVVYLSVGGMEQLAPNLSSSALEKIPETAINMDHARQMVSGVIDAYEYLQRQGNVDVYAHVEEGEVHTSSNIPSFSRGIRTLLLGNNRDALRQRSFDSPLPPWNNENQ